MSDRVVGVRRVVEAGNPQGTKQVTQGPSSPGGPSRDKTKMKKKKTKQVGGGAQKHRGPKQRQGEREDSEANEGE